MIDIEAYRQRIGCYQPLSSKRRVKDDKSFRSSLKLYKYRYKHCMEDDLVLGPSLGQTLGYLAYMYYILIFTVLALNIILHTNDVQCLCATELLPSFLSNDHNVGLPSIAIIHVRLGYFIIMAYFMKKAIRSHSDLTSYDTDKNLHLPAYFLAAIHLRYGKLLHHFSFSYCL